MHPASCGCSVRAQKLPVAPLLGALALAVSTVALVGATGAGWIELDQDRPAAVAPERVSDVRFLDRADGAVVVQRLDGSSTVVRPGEGGFVRAVMRGLAGDRLRRGLGADAPFRLTRWSDGRLTLTDTATGRTVSLDGFGADNRRAFASLLEEGA